MKPNQITENIRALSQTHHLTQEAFASVTGVDVRTVQRAEQGKPLALDSLKAIAAAFDTTIEFLSADPEQWRQIVEDSQRKYEVIPLQIVEHGMDLGAHLAGAEAYWLQKIGELSDPQADAVAAFEQDLKNYMYIWSDLEPIQCRDAEKSLQQVIDNLRRLELTISVASQSIRLKSEASGLPLQVSVLHAAVARQDASPRFLLRDRSAPVHFA